MASEKQLLLLPPLLLPPPCHQVGVPQGLILGPYFGLFSFFPRSLHGDTYALVCARISYVRPCVGPQAIVRQILGADVMLALLSTSTYVFLLTWKRWEEGETGVRGDVTLGVATEEWSNKFPNMHEIWPQEDASPARFIPKISDPPPPPPHSLSLLPLLHPQPTITTSPPFPWCLKWRDNLWRNSKKQESRDYPKRRMEDDGIFKVLPEMIARALGFKGLNLWQNEQKGEKKKKLNY